MSACYALWSTKVGFSPSCISKDMGNPSFNAAFTIIHLSALVTLCAWLETWTWLWTLWATKKGEKVSFICKLPSWILQFQTVFTVGTPCFQSDKRPMRYLISPGFRPPINKNTPEEEFWKLKNNDCVRLLCLVGFLFVCFLRLNDR